MELHHYNVEPGKRPMNCGWYDEVVEWYPNFAAKMLCPPPYLSSLAINPHGVKLRDQRDILLVGPQQYGKSLLIRSIIGERDFRLYTYRPDSQYGLFMAGFEHGHKYILFDDFKFASYQTRLLLGLLESHQNPFVFPTHPKT